MKLPKILYYPLPASQCHSLDPPLTSTYFLSRLMLNDFPLYLSLTLPLQVPPNFEIISLFSISTPFQIFPFYISLLLLLYILPSHVFQLLSLLIIPLALESYPFFSTFTSFSLPQYHTTSPFPQEPSNAGQSYLLSLVFPPLPHRRGQRAQ